MIPASQRHDLISQSNPQERVDNHQTEQFWTRNANTIYRRELWGIVVVYIVMYSSMKASRFLPGALPFLVGFVSAGHLPYVVPSSAQRLTVFQSDLDQKLFNMFPTACAPTIFGGVGIRLWIWTPAPPKSTPAENLQGQDGLTLWTSFSRYTLLVMTGIMVTAVALSMVSYWAHAHGPTAKLKQQPADAASTSETTTVQVQLGPIQAAEFLLHACVCYALQHLVVDTLSVPFAAFASNDWARALVDGASKSGKGVEKGKGKGKGTEIEEEI